jgi:AmmeMemoRadiSam system protein B
MSSPDEIAAADRPLRPRLRRVESFPVNQPGGEVVFALRDPEGFSGSVVLPYHAAVLAALMDGTRTLAEIQADFQEQFHQPVDLADVERVISELDRRFFLDNDRFRARWKAEVETYLNRPVRPAAHAGGAYEADPQALTAQIASFFTAPNGPGALVEQVTAGSDGQKLCAVLSPHIDFRRGGPAFAWAYKKLIEESAADLFVILGTAHNPMRNLFALTKKGFDTPLGTVETDRMFVARLASKMAASPAGKDLNLFGDELAHRQEHSIEFQAVFLQSLLGGKRPFQIVPILVGSFHQFVRAHESPSTSPEVTAFVHALRATITEHKGQVCLISSGDLAHIGQRFGDRAFLDAERLQAQAASDKELMEAACRPDAGGFFELIARDEDRNRVCGLSPTYTMLEVARPTRGELLRYDQAVELDGTSCVSFAAAAFYRD